MAQSPQLSNREQEVVQLLLKGKSNKMIAASLGVSERTVEFHLNNVYTKFGVASRMELVLKLGNATGWLEGENLGDSTVAGKEKVAENRDEFNLSNLLTWLREAVSKIGMELKMKIALDANTRDDTNPITFFESIRICLTKYAEFNGRASRAEFWWFMLFVSLVALALAYLSEILSSVFLIATLLPLLAAGSRRLRDSGKSGWWQLFLLVPVGGIVILGILWAEPPVGELPQDTSPA